ncbi:hypothetical protein [Lysobacter auxotrophicus]|uniref:Uncharacterized protein n=1 Tax=Lysobacter auxotrophicus TaxID=2992573 RepID=A0ABN6ULL8_9GAMM|nr:hypothetical protein [Lysobacter auxotrophicus]BDU17207.1 hypothetical protein LA521A_24080 [Lysobacter auxotrophicus]
MNRFDDEPLSPEERALADRLARLGPHDGPPPSLDAKILAAAHAAVAPPQRRRRWLGLAAVPGSLITGAGMAAALVLVIGTVWQLRPADPAPAPVRSEGDGAYVSAQIIERERKVIAPAPPPPDASTRAKALNAPAASAPILAQRKAAPVAPAAAAPVPEEASGDAMARVATVGPDEQPIVFHETVADARSDDPFTAPAAAPAAPAAMQSYSDAEKSEAFELARARQQRSDEQAVSAKRLMAQPAPVAASAVSAAPASAEPQPTLDRIEVTGSRITPAELLAATPIAEDARLEPAAWLERIRERRDAGDADGARESLALFRRTHPRVRLPDDLRALARSPTTR